MDYLQILIGLIAGFLSGYLTTYFTEKAKNKALLEDIKRLTEERRKVEAAYELDIARRKYQYEDKRTQYFKYFGLIDQMSAEQHKVMLDEFLPIMGKYNKDYLNAYGNKGKETKTVAWFSDAMNKLLMKGNEALIRFRNETHTIKLIAGEEVLELIKDLDFYFDWSFEKSTKILKEIAALVLSDQTDRISDKTRELEVIGNLIKDQKQKLIDAVRRELNEI